MTKRRKSNFARHQQRGSHSIQAAVLTALVIGLVVITGYGLKLHQSLDSLASSPSLASLWPKIYHTNGALFISTPIDAQNAKNNGLTLSLMETYLMTSQLKQTYQQLGMTYVDDDPWQDIQSACGTSGTCSLTATQKQAILNKVKQHLVDTANDPLIVGYMILDDYPGGDVRDVMQGIHDLVVSANTTAVFPRFTECDFGGNLDRRTSTTSPWIIDNHLIDQSLTNFTPTGCDVVMLYLEGYNQQQYYNSPDLIDWSMTNVLPYTLNALKAKGWNPTTQPLIASPQLYDWTLTWWQQNNPQQYLWLVRPTATSVETQIKAYCQAGATAITGYAWNDPYHDASVKYELFNDSGILTGYKNGINFCRTTAWATPTPTLTPTPTPTPTPVSTPTPTPVVTPTPVPVSGGIHLRTTQSEHNASGQNFLTLWTPGVLTSGDVMVAQVAVWGPTTIISPPSGWTRIRRDSDKVSMVSEIYYHVATGSEPTSYTWTFNGDHQAAGGLADYYGVNTGSPVDANSGQVRKNSTVAMAPSVKTTAGGDRLIMFVAVPVNTAVTPQSTMSREWINSASDTTSEMSDEFIGSAGNTGIRAAALGTVSNSIAQMVALRPQ